MTSGLPSPYTRFDTLRAIIEDDPALLTIINRFDIALGFGDSTVESVCTDNGVDTDTFLAVVNFNAGRRWEGFEVSLRQLIGYLRRSHTHFINFALPTIKKMLIDGLHEAPTSEISMVILRFLDSYIADVRAHMDYEDRAIFAYVERLLDGDLSGDPGISEFSSRHVHMASKLDDLKELFIYKFRQRNNEAINAALHQLMLTGTELIRHCEVENIMLLPRVARLEREVRESLEAISVPVTEQEAPQTDVLTEREKEVLRGIASGLSTKEIADRMCLSFHTVNTHRKNIGAKLNIHSLTGLAIYALLHHIIDIDSIELN